MRPIAHAQPKNTLVRNKHQRLTSDLLQSIVNLLHRILYLAPRESPA
jgi:hypothetical protein